MPDNSYPQRHDSRFQLINTSPLSRLPPHPHFAVHIVESTRGWRDETRSQPSKDSQFFYADAQPSLVDRAQGNGWLPQVGNSKKQFETSLCAGGQIESLFEITWLRPK